MARTIKKEPEGELHITQDEAQSLTALLSQLTQARLIVAGFLYNLGEKYNTYIPSNVQLDGDVLRWTDNAS